MKKTNPEMEALKRAVTELGVAEDVLTAKMPDVTTEPEPAGASMVSQLTARIRNITNHMNAKAAAAA